MLNRILRPTMLILLLAAAVAPAAPDEHEEKGRATFHFALIGDTNVHRVRVTVDPDSREVFNVDPVVVPGNSFTH